MKNNILITGGAGFISSYLIKKIKIKKNLILVDKKKNKKLISKFKKLNIKYIHGNLEDKKFSKKIYKNVKLIYHLAGTVKVPSTDVNLNINKERKIYREALKIFNNLVNFTNNKAKVIFPSTHLIFENSKKNKEVFNEKSKPLPYLAYSRSKYKCEQILEESGLNYNILRLGSVYGYTEDENRMFNLPNLFPLRAKKNLNLKLFSKGVQIKSIVSVKDVADAMFHLSNSKFNKQTYNLVSQHLTVKEIGKICQRYNKKIKLISTNDKIPYKGYYMNSNKIKKTNYKFKNFYKDFAKEIILKD